MVKKQGKILIAEDDNFLAKSLKVFLEKNNINIIKILHSGEELIDEALKLSPSLIISDITLKGEIDGIEAIARINRLKDIPYIFITGHSEYLNIIKSYNLKPVKILIKPFDLELLTETVKRFLYSLSKDTYSYNYLG